MSSTAQRTFSLLRQHPVLLGGPLLVVNAFDFVLDKSAHHIINQVFPRVPLGVIRGGGPAVLVAAAEGALVHFVVLLCVQILQLVLQAAIVALMIVLVMHLARYGADTLSAALHRLRQIPDLTGTLFRLSLLFFVIQLITAIVAFVPLLLFLMPHRVPGQPLPHIHPISTLTITIIAGVWLAIVAYFAMPLFLDLVLRVQRRSLPDGLARRQMKTRIWHWALATIVATLALVAMNLGILAPLRGTPAMDHLISRNLLRLAVALVLDLPKFVFVVAATVVVMQVGETVTQTEPV